MMRIVSYKELFRRCTSIGREACANLPVELCLQDYRDLRGTLGRVASLGIFENVGYKNYRTFFEVVHRSLSPGGLFFLWTIGSTHCVRMTDPWIEKYIFPNSHLPSPVQISDAIEGFIRDRRLGELGL
jgi:cyclopropane-fatty-acyl-phospholipid synthase